MAIITMFVIQFKVDTVKFSISQTKKEINSYEKQIKMLDIEWAYLTRPERLRKLSAKYLSNNNFVMASQIRNNSDLEKIYLTNYQKENIREMAMK